MKKKEGLKLLISILFSLLALGIKTESFQFLLFSTSYLIIAIDVIIEALKNIKKKNLLDEHFLMTIATLGAFCLGEYLEAIMVMVLYTIGELLTDQAVEKSKEEITKLMKIRPDYANLWKNGKEIRMNPEQVHKHDQIIIKSGEKIPLDGIIIDGKTTIDMSKLTGESLPIPVQKNDMVFSGSINLSGSIIVKVTKEFTESTVQKILEMVELANNQKSTSEKFITKFSKYYTPIVIAIAGIIGIIIPLLFSLDFLSYFHRALIFLVISCPCALVISVPLSFFCGIGKASQKGILIKNSEALENLTKIDCFLFDKTGTLTQGVFEVIKIESKTLPEEKLLEYASYCEVDSNHPIAQSIKKRYGKSIDKTNIKDITEEAGYGTKAVVHNKKVLVGNKQFMEKYHISIPDVTKENTTIYVAIDHKYQGILEIADVIKEEAKTTVQELKDLGVKKCIMVTGDKKQVAKSVSHTLNLDDFHAELLPNEKVNIVNELLKESKVAFVGDGINDAPVLVTSNLGISMGKIGSDAAMEASDIVIITDNLVKIVEARKISVKTLRIVKQNIVFSLFVKIVILILGALGFANMWMAVIADVGVSILAIFNALRIFKS